MSKKSKLNDLVIMKFISPSINFASLKARIKLKEFRNEFTNEKYKQYFQKCNNITSVTSSMNNRYSMADFHRYERETSEKIKNEINIIDKEFNIFQQKNQDIKVKYKLKFLNRIKNKENIENNIVKESVKKDISKLLQNLHSNDKKKINFGNVKLNLNLSPLMKNSLKPKSVVLHRINKTKSLSYRSNKNRNIINKNRIKKIISIDQSTETVKTKLNLFSNINENKNEKIKKDSFINFKKFPFIRQNSYIPFSYKISIMDKSSLNISSNEQNNFSYLINLPKI